MRVNDRDRKVSRATRRQFLYTGLASLGVAAGFPVLTGSARKAMAAVAKAGATERNLKITGVKTFVISNTMRIMDTDYFKGGKYFVILKLMTNEGIVGYGEPSLLVTGKERAAVELIDELAEAFVIGSNPFDIENLFTRIYKSNYGLQHPDLTRLPVTSAFEMACWDIIGKALNQPIYNLLGGKCHDRLRTYTYLFGYTTGMGFPLEAAAENIRYYLEQGFTAIGFDPAGRPLPRPRSLSLDELRTAEKAVGLAREIVGDKCDILLKTHGQMTTHSAIRLAKRLEQFDPFWFEEPVPLENVDEMARVARSTSIPIATGERLTTKFEFREVLDKQAAQILNVAVGRVGGILEAKKVAAMAEVHYAQIAPWLSSGPIAGAASLQLSTCCQNFLIQEGLEKWDGFFSELVTEPFRWEKGYIIPPTGPGLGVELNEEVAAKHPYK